VGAVKHTVVHVRPGSPDPGFERRKPAKTIL
jgi:hypothetical protein